MRNPIPKIWQTYWLQFNSIVAWLLIAALLFVAIASATIQLPWSNVSIRRLAPMLTHYDDSQSITFDLRNNNFLPSSPESSELLHLRNLPPNVNAVSINIDKLNQLDVDQLRSLSTLKQLTLSADQIPNDTLSTLAPDLRELKISSNLLLAHTDELPSLERVHLLITDNLHLHKDLFSAAAQLPNLQTLVISSSKKSLQESSYEDDTSVDIKLTQNDISPIINKFTFTTIYANWPHNSPLPRTYPLRVFPYSYSTRLVDIPWFTWLPVLAALGFVYTQSRELCNRPSFRLIPDAFNPHFILSTTIVLSIFFICQFTLRLAHFPIFASLASSLIPVSLFWLGTSLVTGGVYKHGYSPAIMAYVYANMLTTLLPTRVLSTYLNAMQGFLEPYAFITVVTQIILIIFCVRRTIFSWGLADDSPPGSRFFRRTPSPVTTTSSFTLQHHHPTTFWAQVRLWRAGNGRAIWQPFAYLSLVMIMLAPLTNITSSGWLTFFSIVPAGLFFSSYLIMAITIITWTQRTSLSNETLRPFTRKQLAHRLIASISIDFTWLSIVSIITYTLGYLIPFTHDLTLKLLFGLPLILTAQFFAWSLTLAIFLETKRSQDFLLFVLAIPFSLCIYFLLTDLPKDTNLALLISLSFLAIFSLLSSLITYTAYHRFTTHEWPPNN